MAVPVMTQTLATITIQNYFRMYDKLAGMTGTAETEETEFYQIYKLDVVVIPTNRAVRRVDKHDLIYKTRREKYNAILDEVERQHGRGDRKSTRLNSSHSQISYAVFCLKKN